MNELIVKYKLLHVTTQSLPYHSACQVTLGTIKRPTPLLSVSLILSSIFPTPKISLIPSLYSIRSHPCAVLSSIIPKRQSLSNQLPSEHVPKIQAVFFSPPATTLSLGQPSAAPPDLSLFPPTAPSPFF